MNQNIFKERRTEAGQTEVLLLTKAQTRITQPIFFIKWLLNEVVFYHTSSGHASTCVQVKGIVHYKTELDLIIVMLSLLHWQVTHDVD